MYFGGAEAFSFLPFLLMLLVINISGAEAGPSKKRPQSNEEPKVIKIRYFKSATNGIKWAFKEPTFVLEDIANLPVDVIEPGDVMVTYGSTDLREMNYHTFINDVVPQVKDGMRHSVTILKCGFDKNLLRAGVKVGKTIFISEISQGTFNPNI